MFDEEILFFILVGLIAQFIDGSLGMAYGVSASTLLISLGISPLHASASIHISELFTTTVSGISHYGFGNVDRQLMKKLIIPGMIGAAGGALTLVWIPLEIVKPLVGVYLMLMGASILYKAYQNIKAEKHKHNLTLLGLTGGFLDSAGGGGWGTVVASTLVARGSVPRLAIGSVNAAEFFVALSSSFTFIFMIGIVYWKIVVGLALGGILAAPFAAWFARHIPSRLLMILIGITIIILSIRTIYLALSGQ